MSDEKLRLEAEVRDNMSPALRKIKDTLNSIRQTPGMEAATDGIKKLGAETAKFATFGGNAAVAMGALGLGGLAAAGSLAAVVEQMKALGQRAIDMKELGRETGVSVNWLNAWSHAGLSFGVSADAMQSALNHLAGQMPEFRNRMGPLFFLLSQRFPTLTKKLLSEDTEAQIKDITALLNSDKLKANPQLQKQLASEFFGNGDDIEKLFKNGADGFWKEFQRQQSLLNPINPELTKQAQAFKDSQIAFNDALENFENRYGPAFLKTMSSVVNEARTLMDDLNGKKANPSEPNKLWGSLSHGDITGFGSELGKVFANSVMTELGLSEKQKADLLSSAPSQAPHPAPSGRYGATYHRSSYDGDGSGLFQRTALVTGGSLMRGSDVGLAGIISDGTKTGVLAAFRELLASQDAERSAAGVPGIVNASYETRGLGGGGAGGGGDGGYGAGGPRGRSGGSGEGGGDLLGPDTPSAHVGLGRGAKGMQGRAEETYAFWRKMGFSRNASLGFVGNEQGETGLTGGPKLHWDGSHYSGGLVQWDPGRRAAIAKALGIDVWHDKNHLHQLQAEAWELKTRYPKLWAQLRQAGISVSQAARGLVHHYELPADPEGQSRLRGGMGEAWAPRLSDRKATGLSDNGSAPSGGKAPPQGSIRADIHVKGAVEKAHVKSTGAIEARLHRWPNMEFA